METLFAYGTLQDPEVQLSLMGRTLESQPDKLDGYQINRNLLPPYPVAMPNENSSISGQVLKISADELQKLDAYEGECYLRIRVWLASTQEAWVYIGNPSCYPDIDLMR